MHSSLAQYPLAAFQPAALAVDTGPSDIGTTWFDACMLVAEAADSLRCADGRPQCVVDVSVPDLPVVIAGDARKLSHVLRNLAAAALRCAGSNRVFLGLAVYGSTLEFKVAGADSRNISAEECWASFHRPGTFAGPGALALAGDENSVQVLGGSLVVSLRAGGGCTFLLTLPVPPMERRGWMHSAE